MLPVGEDPTGQPWESFAIEAAWVSSQVDLALTWLLTADRWTPNIGRVLIRVPEEYLSVVEAAIECWCELVRAFEDIWKLESNERLLQRGMSVHPTVDDVGDLTVRIDPVAPTYLAADESRLPGHYEIRRACFPADVGGGPAATHAGASVGARPPEPPAERALTVIMSRIFAKPSFRPGQVRAIQQAVTSSDTLILFPTGHGKSLVFQMAAFLVPGLALIIEPFRALLDDQERNLQDHGISSVISLHSGRPMHGAELRRRLRAAGLVYVAAERMHVSEFIRDLVECVRVKGIALFIVDEAHTVSQFGHSFRPAYLDLSERVDAICEKAGRLRPTVLALTATAAQRVVRDIQALLHINGEPISLDEHSLNSFVRSNLSDDIFTLQLDRRDIIGEARHVADDRRKANVREQLGAALAQAPEGQGIVFCPSKRQFKPISWTKRPAPANGSGSSSWIAGAPLLGARGIRDQLNAIMGAGAAVGLYTGASDDDDDSTAAAMAADARDFSQGRLDVMVATSAFGTGVDLQGVRWTLHVGMPGGLEAYYQESGRAGRDGTPARNFLFVDWDSEDLLDAIAVDASEEDPLAVVQQRLRDVTCRGSVARQLSLLIGEEPPRVDGVTVRDPVVLLADDGTPRQGRDGKHTHAFRPAYPGWKWEARHVDAVLHREVLAYRTGATARFWCHTWWEDLVWKAMYRLATLGVIRHGFEHQLRKSDGRTSFVFERIDDDATLTAGSLCKKVGDEVERLAGPARASAAVLQLTPHLEAADPNRRLLLCTAMLLKTVYRVVYETRIESLRSLVRYAREPLQERRREIIEDYFAPSDIKRRLFALCAERPTLAVLKAALSLAESEPRWKSGMFEVAAAEFAGSPVPQLLLAIGGIKRHDASECARYLYTLLSEESISVALRSWCYSEVVARARQAGVLPDVLSRLPALMKGSPVNASLAVLARELQDADGESQFAHALVAQFLRDATDNRS
jgi:ATP-dependent DNA helicase RecQ